MIYGDYLFGRVIDIMVIMIKAIIYTLVKIHLHCIVRIVAN